MKKARKGFTLVELLIVVAILATLTATMTYSISGSTAKAKAAAIANNVNAARAAVALYVINNASDGLKDMTTDQILYVAIPAWTDFGDTTATTPIKYQAVNTTDKGSDKWAIKVDFSADPEKDDIKTALQAIKGYNKYNKHTDASDNEAAKDEPTVIMGDNVYAFKVMLTSGQILPAD